MHDKILLLFASLLVTACAADASAWSPVSYPGRTWGNLSRDFSGFEGSGTQGWVSQGVDWYRLPGDIGLETSVLYQWRARSLNRPFYNEHGPAARVSFVSRYWEAGLGLGSNRYPELGRTERDFNLFGTWYKSWDLSARMSRRRVLGVPFLRLPFSTWGRLSRDLDGFEGTSAQGWVEQGVDWLKLPGGITFQTFAGYRWRARTRNDRFYNAVGPAVGMQFIRSPFNLGFEYSWKRYTELGQNTGQAGVFLSWYMSWNLAR